MPETKIAPSDAEVLSSPASDNLDGFRGAEQTKPPLADANNREPNPGPAADDSGIVTGGNEPTVEADGKIVKEDPKPKITKTSRSDIYANARAARDKRDDDGAEERLEDFMTPEQRQAMHGVFAKPADGDGQGDAAKPAAGQPQAADGQVAAEGETVPMVKLTVNGKTVYKPKAEVDAFGGIAAAQLTLAAEERLERAKADAARIIQDAQRVAGATGQQPAQNQGRQPEGAKKETQAPGQTSSGLPREKLAEIRDQLLLGGDEEGLQAVEQLADLLRTQLRTETAEIIPQTLESQRAQEEDERALGEAVANIARDYGDSVKDPDYQRLFTHGLIEEALRELERLGTTPEDMAMLSRSPEAIRLNYANLLRTGWTNPETGARLPPYQVLADRAADRVAQKFKLPAPDRSYRQQQSPRGATPQQPAPTVAVNRSAREAVKEGLVTQPKSTLPGGGGRVQPQGAPQPRDPSQVVKDMRRSRGQPVA